MTKQYPLVSVIVPAYNTADYVEEMIGSVAAQTYPNMEVIFVNDGSKDDTLNVIRRGVKSYNLKNAQVMDIPNGGVSNARNVAMDVAHGKWIFFWDSDDTMEPFAIEHCVQYAQENNVNAVLFNYANRVDGKRGEPHISELNGIYRGREFIEKLVPHFLGHSFADVNEWIRGKKGMREGKESTALWRIMLNAQTIRDCKLRCDTNLSLGEDTKFLNQYLLRETSVGYLSECLYYLTIRQTGANLTSINNAKKRLEDKLKLIDARMEIDNEAIQLHNTHIHGYWEGTLVFSAVEMTLRMASNRALSARENFRLYNKFINNAAVSKALKDFRPAFGLRSLPFRLLKVHLGKCLFWIIRAMPKSLLSKVNA